MWYLEIGKNTIGVVSIVKEIGEARLTRINIQNHDMKYFISEVFVVHILLGDNEYTTSTTPSYKGNGRGKQKITLTKKMALSL